MEFQAYNIAIVPVIVALVQLVIAAGLPKRFAPIVSVIFGLIAAAVYIAPGDWPKAVLVGIVIGLSAVGLFSGVKNTIKSTRRLPNNSKSIGK